VKITTTTLLLSHISNDSRCGLNSLSQYYCDSKAAFASKLLLNSLGCLSYAAFIFKFQKFPELRSQPGIEKENFPARTVKLSKQFQFQIAIL
jgi:hypothetical protein